MRKIAISMVSVMLAAVLLLAQIGLAGVLDDDAPAVNLQAVVTADGRVKVTWNFPSYPYAVSISAVRSLYQVKADYQRTERYPGNDFYFTPPEQNAYIIIMYYQLTPSSVWSDRATTVVYYQTPFSPISLEVGAVNAFGMVTLKWDDVNWHETGWFINVAGVDSQMNPVNETIAMRVNDGHTAEVTITNPLKPEGQYTFTVWAVNGGLVGPSASVSAVIKLKAPTNLTAQAKRNGAPYVELNWTANANADCYEIERTNPDGSKTHITTTTDDTFWPDTDVRAMSTYQYRVRAVYSDRPDYTSDYSENVIVATFEFIFVTGEPAPTATPDMRVKPGVIINPGVIIKPTATVKPTNPPGWIPPPIRK